MSRHDFRVEIPCIGLVAPFGTSSHPTCASSPHSTRASWVAYGPSVSWWTTLSMIDCITSKAPGSFTRYSLTAGWDPSPCGHSCAGSYIPLASTTWSWRNPNGLPFFPKPKDIRRTWGNIKNYQLSMVGYKSLIVAGHILDVLIYPGHIILLITVRYPLVN